MVSIDEVATGLLVNAISAAGRWLWTAAGMPRQGNARSKEDLAVARWFESYELTKRIPPDVSHLSPEAIARLRELLRGDDAQAAVQELLAVRLTDGSNSDAARAKEALVLTLAISNNQEIVGYAENLATYYDDEISDLVGRLRDTPMLGQMRSEGLSNRTIAVLHAIERHTAALASRPALRTENDFLARYSGHVLDQYGKLEPPDFERRRRVPIHDIYVPTVIHQEQQQIQGGLAPHEEPPPINVWDLAALIDRTVLLGDPGGGKTTASTVLMHHFAAETTRRTPFLVTLRNFAADDSPARSVLGHIEHELETLYQCPAPPGLVDLLLLTGRALVIFDGLDELLDTSRRADVATRVERFCGEYPLAPVLVTSRAVGYDQARLDESQFTIYRLGGFRDEDVASYVRKWFALDDGAELDDANAFLTESKSVPDLRSNPLLLSLMCILYRGEGSLPRNRAEIYEHCSNLLFRRWDARRRIHQELRAGHLVEPALRYLAWWLFTRADTQASVTERELISAATDFLHGRGFEAAEDASDAAREFVEFSRGRMWVFSDHGTSASGERLYAFTHRTFLEYFAAAQLAFDSDTPEKLAKTLLPRVARGELEVVGELAVQIKNRTSTDGAKRVYKYMLDDRRRRSPESASNILQFLARTLRSADPSPQVTRLLAVRVLHFLFSGDLGDSTYYLPFLWLIGNANMHATIVDAEIDAEIGPMMTSGDPSKILSGARFTLHLDTAIYRVFDERKSVFSSTGRTADFWRQKSAEKVEIHRATIAALASSDDSIRIPAAQKRIITADEALDMPGGLGPLLRSYNNEIFGGGWSAILCVYFQWLVWNLSDYSTRIAAEYLSAVGRHASRLKNPPWTHGPIEPWLSPKWEENHSGRAMQLRVEPSAYLGGAIVVLTCAEAPGDWASGILSANPSHLGVFTALHPYIKLRQQGLATRPLPELPDLPVPEEFNLIFREWANGKIDFIGKADLLAGANPKSPLASRCSPPCRDSPAAYSGQARRPADEPASRGPGPACPACRRRVRGRRRPAPQRRAHRRDGGPDAGPLAVAERRAGRGLDSAGGGRPPRHQPPGRPAHRQRARR